MTYHDAESPPPCPTRGHHGPDGCTWCEPRHEEDEDDDDHP